LGFRFGFFWVSSVVDGSRFAGSAQMGETAKHSATPAQSALERMQVPERFDDGGACWRPSEASASSLRRHPIAISARLVGECAGPPAPFC
jgi:hypothetical protein